MSTSQTWFVTGASQGLGLALVRQLLAAGHRVAATSRRLSSLTQLLGDASASFLPLETDLTTESSVAQAVSQATSTFGRLDVVVNNAGYGIGGSVEELSDAETRQAFDVNVFGMLNVIRQALPHMRTAGSGHIINISSIAGISGNVGWAIYAATKYAVEGVSEVLAQDLAPLGIKVTVVAPGAFRTNFLTPESLVLARQPIEAYQAVRASHEKYLAMNGTQAGDPEKAAGAIMQLAAAAHPPVHLLLGQDAYKRATLKLETFRQELEAWHPLTVSTGFAE
ncbi:oxidoreductase [Hymenobacter pini]|uniref:oxidoreductase n=1 Tax=Hymenobacter pini TaxID=2880879 RepID=UPI001CF0E1E0|nr:oxidoreductase [Hymenobacter pini]MCA8831078.1 SDR family NAD(P)-dependent oxidoreductase [Hymenobacter pini]